MNKQLEDRLFREDDIFKYLELLKEFKNDYLIIMAVKDTAGKNMPECVKEKIKDLGFRNFVNELWVTYIGVIDNGRIISDQRGIKPESPIHFETIIENGIEIEVYSESFKNGNRCVINVNGKDYARNTRGINIVVYNMKSQSIVDSVAYDSHEKNEKFNRVYLKIKGDSYRKRSSVDYILPMSKKVRIVYWGGAYFWNVFDTFVEEIRKEHNIDIKVIIIWKDAKDVEEVLIDKNIPYVHFEEYRIEDDQPDILLFSSNNDVWQYSSDFLTKMRKNSRLLVLVPVALILNGYDSLHSYKNNLIAKAKKYNVDYIIMDKLMYSICMENEIYENIMVEIGNPKFDSIYRKITSIKEVPKEWEKIENKCVVLWLVDHDWKTGTNVSFDIYAQKIFEYFANSKEMALIFRPHPRFVIDTIGTGIWTKSDAEQLKTYIFNTDNIVWDEFSDYSLSYQMADAIMSEVESGTIISALATKKPICILYRNDCKVYNNHRQVTENYYSCYSEAELIEFLDNIRTGNDPMYNSRCEAFYKYISHFDGLNGKRLKEFILDKYDEKCKEPAER